MAQQGRRNDCVGYFSWDSYLSVSIHFHAYLVTADWVTDYFTTGAIVTAIYIFTALSTTSGDFRHLLQTSSYSLSLGGVTGAVASAEQ